MEENSKKQEKETTKVENTEVKEVETAKNEKVETKKAEAEKTKNAEVKETKPAKSEKDDTKTNATDKKENTKKDEKFKKKAEKQTKKSKMPLILGVIGILLLIIIVSALVFWQESPAKAIDGMFSSLKQGDFNKVNEYVNLQELLKEANLENETNEDKEKEKLFFDKLKWKINKVNQEKDKATAEVEVTNKDFKIIITNYMQKILKIAFGGENISEQEMENYLLELLKDEKAQTVTNSKNIELIKENGKWRVVANSELTSIILPGLEDAIDSLNEITE